MRRWSSLRHWVIATLLPVVALAQSAQSGKELFERRCGGCHSLDRDKEGPRLGGVYGRMAGKVESFGYSDALRKSGIVWKSETLEKWLADPEAVAPGNNMTFHVDKAEERRAIVEFLRKN